MEWNEENLVRDHWFNGKAPRYSAALRWKGSQVLSLALDARAKTLYFGGTKFFPIAQFDLENDRLEGKAHQPC